MEQIDEPENQEIEKVETRGAPAKPLNWEVIESLCFAHCTLVEIAGYFHVHKNTIKNRIKAEFGQSWEEYFEMHSAKGKISLRRAQFKSGLAGNTRMLEHLGDVILGQRKSSQLEITAGKQHEQVSNIEKMTLAQMVLIAQEEQKNDLNTIIIIPQRTAQDDSPGSTETDRGYDSSLRDSEE